jgi:hypothetical protein
MFSAAGATVLSHIFPEDAATFEAWSQEAALSRLYGGIHYRFDITAGEEAGKEVGSFAVNHMMLDGGE